MGRDQDSLLEMECDGVSENDGNEELRQERSEGEEELSRRGQVREKRR